MAPKPVRGSDPGGTDDGRPSGTVLDEGAHERGQAKRAVVVVVLVWLAFVLPTFAGQVRFPVDFAGSQDGRPTVLANPEQGDAYYLYPWHHYLGERLAHGEVPLWDPHRFGGTPFAADIAVGLWYPPNWLYAFGHPLHVFTVISVASGLIALLLVYWFLRVLRLHPYAAAFGAIGFAFSAFIVKWATNEPVTASVIWIALPLGGLEVARRGKRWRGTLLAAAGLALAVVGGHAQLALFVWLTAFVWTAIDLAATTVHARRAGLPLGVLPRRLAAAAAPAAVAVALALGLTAVQLLPTKQMVDGIVRQKTTWEVARATFLPRRHAATFLLPDYLGSPIDHNYDGPGVNYTETMAYAGILTLPLALYGALHRRRRVVLLFVTLTAIGFLSIVGTPFYRLVIAAPGLSRGLFATRFILLVDFGLAGLAALGVDRLVRRERLRHGRAVLGGSFVASLVGVGWLTLGRPGTSLPASYILPLGARATAVLALGAGAVAVMMRVPSWSGRMSVALILVSASDLWMTGYRFNPFHAARPVYTAQPPIGDLRSVPGVRPRYASIGTYILPPNAAMVHGLYGLDGYDPLIALPMVELVGVAEDQLARAHSNFLGPFRPATAASPIFDLLGVDNLVGQIERVDAEASVGRPMLARPGAFPPAFAATCWELTQPNRVLDRISTMSSPALRDTVVVDDVPAARSALHATAGRGCTAGEVRVTRYEPERVVMDSEAARPSLVVLTDSWFPGWEATVDGKHVDVLRVDHALRGVAVGAGRHEVVMRFRPRPYRTGAAISLATILGLTGAVAGRTLRRRRGPPGSPRRR